jgi:FkbM family methyltransferase
MNSKTKTIIKKITRKIGFDIKRYSPKQIENGRNAFIDIRSFLKGIEEPTIFDVGANVGQSALRYVKDYPNSRIHSFEPSPTTFDKLRTTCSSHSQVNCWNYGVGSENGVLEFLENNHPDMSSFLPPSEFAWGKIIKKTDVKVVSLDSFAQEQQIDYIHLLKSDTQGFDFEVFKGAKRLMQEKKIGLIYFEFIFSDMYKNSPSLDHIYRYLIDQGFLLVSFYDFHYQKGLASWTDALFISHDYYENRFAP